MCVKQRSENETWLGDTPLEKRTCTGATWMARLPLTLGNCEYDHGADLMDGRIMAEGNRSNVSDLKNSTFEGYSACEYSKAVL